MDEPHIYDEPSEVPADDGVVAVEGPDAVRVTLTPNAAAETAQRLFEGATAADQQRRVHDPHVQRSREALAKSLELLRKTVPDAK